VTNNNGFWVGWLDLLALLYNYNQWLPKTRSIPYWTTSVFSSAVTDLVLIYESATSSASVVHWLTLHSWTLNYWIAFWILLRMNYDWINLLCVPLLYSSAYPKKMFVDCAYPWKLFVDSVDMESAFRTKWSPCIRISIETCVSEPFSSNGLFRFSGVMPQHVNQIKGTDIRIFI
jgi:hypothetical protein